VAQPDDRAPASIAPVPEGQRVLGALDLGLLWGNLGVSLLVIVAGAILVPALSLPAALAAIVIGCAVGNLMLGAAAAIGAQARVPAMVLMRAPLGERGSFVPTILNVLQCLGWTVFELIVIATAAAALSDELLGFEARWAWTILFGALALVLALMGPIGVVRRFIRRVAVWVMPIALAYLTWWAIDGADLGALWSQEGEGGLAFWQGADIVVAVTVSWIPLAADYTRFARTPRDAFWGTGVGYFVPDAWLLALGAVLLLGRDLSDPVALPDAVAAGGLVALVALLALTVGETDEAFANAYSGAVSLQNLFPSVPLKLLVVATTGIGTLGALTIGLGSFQTFLFLLGSFFVPLFAVLLADWLVAGRAYDSASVFGAPAWRPAMIVAWLAGFALYQWLTPTGPSWWTDAVAHLDPPQWSIPVTVPSFLVSFCLAAAAAAAGRRGATVRA
jgi:NCS1 family nucleobase:cation symporter-1